METRHNQPKYILLIMLAFFIVGQPFAHSQELTDVRGQVKNAGNPSQRKTSLTTRAGEDPIQLCEGGLRYTIAQLPGSIITVTGRFTSSSKEQAKCFMADAYSINEVAPGRPAIVGDLKLIEKKTYAVVGHDGRTWRLSALAPGLNNLVGNKVVSDLIADNSSPNETTWLVVRMFSKPD
jgi:hypothetical protein